MKERLKPPRQPSFYDRRVRAVEDYFNFKQYIRWNPVKRGLVAAPADYPYSSAWPGVVLDEVPQRLKPESLSA
jgi:hypothetical protein